MKIVMVPNPTGTGHSMRMYSIAKELLKEQNVDITVFLGSMQNVFVNLFEEIGVEIVDLNPYQVVNYAKKSHLEEQLNWSTLIESYFSPTFFNGSIILKYIDLLKEYQPDMVVSDYNINATIAAGLMNIKNTFVTERHNFTLVDVSDNILKEGGFEINGTDLKKARSSMNSLFEWIGENTELILTDKPYVEEMDKDSAMERFLNDGKAVFVGPMIRPIDEEKEEYLTEIGVDPDKGPIVVATVSGTTMFSENKDNMINQYIDLYNFMKKDYPDIQFVLLGRDDIQVPEGMISIPYLRNWIPLLKKCDLLLSHPGWITVTEISALHVPTVFCLASFKEYHEAEAYLRLEKLGYYTHYGFDTNSLYDKVSEILITKENLLENYKKIAPDALGASKAARLILDKVNHNEKSYLLTTN
ncbi:glycosyltransferase [Bacillus albus]|uniref:glycosyltransferase n=1 Tax=Bacillus albus TaxID=2026189 RepID=UPI002E30C7BB|nr:glycosyltransferase [Bacillus albus]